MRVPYTPTNAPGQTYEIESDRHGSYTVKLHGKVVKRVTALPSYFGRPKWGSKQLEAGAIEDGKLERALTIGATDVLNPTRVDVPQSVTEMTGGRGADLAFECVGYTDPVNTAIRSVRKGGMVTLVGNLAPQIDVPLQYVVTRQIRLQGSCASCGEYPQCIDLMARGIIQVAPLISAVAPLAEGASWFDRLYRHEPGLGKVVLCP